MGSTGRVHAPVSRPADYPLEKFIVSVGQMVLIAVRTMVRFSWISDNTLMDSLRHSIIEKQEF